ncbi:MAG TPA: protein kinase [Gemmatimonadaceae bacterium]|nr:protein kinase [Gemmatimonadaceae bacterium]
MPRLSGATAQMAAHDTTMHTGPASDASRTGGLMTHTRIGEALRTATIGEYEILRELGRGGMATVYLAHDLSLDRKVAIKVMSPALLDSEGAAERFKREAKTAGNLSHPHIIAIHAVKQSGDLLYFVMKFVEGRSLDSVIREQGALPVAMVIQILTEVSGALAYAHRKGVVHRDMKPANIMLDDDGWAVVTDFGIAKVTQQQGLTLTGATVGTPAYMSPEQCTSKDVTGQSDQYSLGIVGYELLTGRVPFSAESMMEMFLQHMNDAPAPLRDARPDCPPRLAQILERMMAKQPKDRFPNLDEVTNALSALQKPEAREATRTSIMAIARASQAVRASEIAAPASPIPIGTKRPAAPARAPRGRILAAGVTSVLVVAAAAGWFAMRGRTATTEAPPRASSTQMAHDTARHSDSAEQSQRPATVSANTVAARRDSSKALLPTASGAQSRAAPLQTTSIVPANLPTAHAPPPQVTPAGDTSKAVAPPANAQPAVRKDSAIADLYADAPSFIEISTGGSTTCGALANEAGVLCWGAVSPTGTVLQGFIFSKLSLGDSHMCGITPSGEAFCWGSNAEGQLGDGTTKDRDKPTPVAVVQRFTEISVGAAHTCALGADGTAYCWGANKFGQLGDGSRSNRNKPVLVRTTAGNQGFQSLAAGGSHTCGVTRTNKAYCWGDGFSGQVGNAMQDFAVEPFAVKTDLSFRTVVAGDRHTCGLTTSGRVYCWGENKNGQLGNDTRDDRNVPDSVVTDQVFRAIASGGQHTCGITTRRQLMCWGQNVDGRLGDGTRSSRQTPVLAAGGQTFTLVSPGSGHTCALLTSGHAMCWGGNSRAQLGGGTPSAYSPTPIVVRVKGGG